MRVLAAGMAAWVLGALLTAAPAGAITVDPDGANVRHTGPTTVFLTFRGLRDDQRAAEGVWCGEIDPVTEACVPGTEFGRLPDRFDLGRVSGVSRRNFTDIMNIPPSVARRAFQAARAGRPSEFFYVRRFVSSEGPDEFVSVSCRMAGGGARTQLAIMAVQLRFDGDRPVLFVPRDSPPAPMGADIHYDGPGRLKGRWEIVYPGDPQPSFEDLLTEATLPVELRGLQRRYTVLERFDVFLTPTGHIWLPGPDPSKLPHQSDGLYQVLLRIEATADRDSRSNTQAFGPESTTLVFSGGVAGFPIPPLRYYVGTGDDREAIRTLAAAETLEPIVPLRRARIPASERVNFSWTPDDDAAVYKLEVENESGGVLSALIASSVVGYTAPPFLGNQSGQVLRWRVVAIGPDGDPIARSGWRDFQIVPDAPPPPTPAPAPTP